MLLNTNRRNDLVEMITNREKLHPCGRKFICIYNCPHVYVLKCNYEITTCLQIHVHSQLKEPGTSTPRITGFSAQLIEHKVLEEGPSNTKFYLLNKHKLTYFHETSTKKIF